MCRGMRLGFLGQGFLKASDIITLIRALVVIYVSTLLDVRLSPHLPLVITYVAFALNFLQSFAHFSMVLYNI